MLYIDLRLVYSLHVIFDSANRLKSYLSDVAAGQAYSLSYQCFLHIVLWKSCHFVSSNHMRPTANPPLKFLSNWRHLLYYSNV